MACLSKKELVGPYAGETMAFLNSVGFVNISSVKDGSIWKNGRLDIDLCLSEDCVITDHQKLVSIVWNTGITIGVKLGEQKVYQKINNKFQNWMKDLN